MNKVSSKAILAAVLAVALVLAVVLAFAVWVALGGLYLLRRPRAKLAAA